MDKVTILSRKRFLEYLPDVAKEKVVAIRIGDKAPVKDKTSDNYADTLSLAFYDEWTFAENLDRNTPLGSNRLTIEDKIIIDNFIDQYVDC